MSQQHLEIPAVFFGDGSEVNKRMEKAAKAIARGKTVAQALDLTPSEWSENPSIDFDISNPSHQGNAFHMGYLAVNTAIAMPAKPGKGFSDIEAQEEFAYDELLKYPYTALSFFPRNSSLWIIDGPAWEGKLSKSRVDKLLKAFQHITPWLKMAGKRFVGGISGDPQYAYQVHSIVTFLAARNDLPQPTSWEEWEATLEQLLKVEDWRQKVSH